MIARVKKINDISRLAKSARENSSGWMLKRLCSQLDLEMKQALESVDISTNQFAVLMTVMEFEGLTQTELGEKIAMPGYATTRTLDSLEARQLVERRADESSRRSHRIYLTTKGCKLGPRIFAIIDKVNTKFLATINKTDQNRFNALLKKLLCTSLK